MKVIVGCTAVASEILTGKCESDSPLLSLGLLLDNSLHRLHWEFFPLYPLPFFFFFFAFLMKFADMEEALTSAARMSHIPQELN